MNKYEIAKAREGEGQEFLDDGWEPFAVVAEDTSYYYTDSVDRKSHLQHRSTIYIWFRRKRNV